MMTDSLSLPIASTQKRIAAFVIDDLIITLFFIVIFSNQISAMFGDITEVNEAVLEHINLFIAENILIVLSIKILYHTILVWQNGMTIGKYLTKIKVISLENHQRPSLVQAFLRAFLRIISETFFYLGFIMAFFTPLRQTLHDKLSQCVVIDD